MATGSEILLTQQQHSDLSSIAQSGSLPGRLIALNHAPSASSRISLVRNKHIHQVICRLIALGEWRQVKHLLGETQQRSNRGESVL